MWVLLLTGSKEKEEYGNEVATRNRKREPEGRKSGYKEIAIRCGELWRVRIRGGRTVLNDSVTRTVDEVE